MSFLVLVGSHARGDFNERSDIDVVSIGSPPPFSLVSLSEQGDAPVNVIAYSSDDFRRIYEQGSLFLQHCFLEGRLLAGVQSEWSTLRDQFRVQSEFRDELFKCLSVCGLLSQTEIFGGYFRTPLVAAFTQAKNAAIYFLAHTGAFVFSKDKALRSAAAALAFDDIDLVLSLKDVYDFSVRELDVPLSFSMTDTQKDRRLILAATTFVERAYDACR